MTDLGPFEFFTTGTTSGFLLKKKRRILYTITCRYLPILLICFALIYIKALQNATSAWLNLLPVLGLFLAAILFMWNYTLKIEMKEEGIFITKQFFFSRKITRALDKKEIKKIELRARYTRQLEVFYRLTTTDDETEDMLEFPLGSGSAQRIEQVNKHLTAHLQLPVEVFSR